MTPAPTLVMKNEGSGAWSDIWALGYRMRLLSVHQKARRLQQRFNKENAIGRLVSSRQQD